MVYGGPILWVRNDRDSYRVVSDEQGTRLEPTDGPAARIVLSVIFLVAASLFLGASVSIIQNHTETSSVIDGEETCRSDQIEVKIGDNPLYCKWIGFPDSNELFKLEVSEDQHIREETRFEDDVWVETYRWEDVDESIVYGFIEEGTYFCVRFIPEFSLEEDWKVEDLYGSFSYPEWCDTEVTDEENRTYEEGAHPYDDVWMYHASDIGDMANFLHMHKVEENAWSYQEFESRASVAADLAYDAWHEQTEYPLELVCCSLPIGFVFLFAADQRRSVFVIDRSSQRITRKRAGSLPSLLTTWSDVDFNSVQLLRSVRIQKHSSGNGEEGHVSHWTTQHHGVNVMLTMEGHTQTLFFFEDDNDLTVHEEVLKDLMGAMGVDSDSLNIVELDRGTWDRPTLHYFTEVRSWDSDGDAEHILEWYYRQQSVDVLFDRGKSVDELYKRPIYEGAGLTTVANREDAERLLAYVIALRDKEREAEKNKPVDASESKRVGEGDGKTTTKQAASSEAASPVNKGGPWGYGPVEDKTQTVVSKDENTTDDDTIPSFWSFDGAEKP